jgi:PilZ domain
MIMTIRSATAHDELEVRSPDAERRSSVRRRTTFGITYRILDGDERRVEARVRDLSTLGIGFVVPTPLRLSALLEIELRSPKSLLVRQVLARVVHLCEETPRTWIAGCAFVNELSTEELKLFHAEAVRPSAGDNRRWVRFPCNVETVCYTCETSPGERRPARILNVSPGGIGLLLPVQFGQGTLLRFELPAGVDQPARILLVRVARVIEQAPGMWFLGCEFAHQLDEDELRMLLR